MFTRLIYPHAMIFQWPSFSPHLVVSVRIILGDFVGYWSSKLPALVGFSSPFDTRLLAFGLLPYIIDRDINAGTVFSKKLGTIVNELRGMYVKRFQSRQRHALDRNVIAQ